MVSSLTQSLQTCSSILKIFSRDIVGLMPREIIWISYALNFFFPDGVNANAMTRSYEPMFVAPPPKTQRLLHSEAYIK